MENEKKTRWGGKREGAGRKKIEYEFEQERRKNRAIYCDFHELQDMKKILNYMRRHGKTEELRAILDSDDYETDYIDALNKSGRARAKAKGRDWHDVPGNSR